MKILLAGTATTLLSKTNDDSIYSSWNNEQKMNSTLTDAGDYLGSGIPGVLIVGMQYWLDPQDLHAQSHLRSLIWGTGLVQLMKYSIGRNRPGNSENRHSFPSGHMTTSFATATSLAYAYGWKAAAVAYPLAIFVGASRVAKGTHWFSDVVAGAFLGYWVGRSGFYDYEITDSQRLTLYPAVGLDDMALNLTYSF